MREKIDAMTRFDIESDINDKLRECPIRLVEIFNGKDDKWKGWYNVFNSDGTCIIGPLEPYKSKPLVDMVNAWNTSHQPKHETVEQWEELKEENTDLNISIRKVTDERDMAVEALEQVYDDIENDDDCDLTQYSYVLVKKALSKLKDKPNIVGEK